MSVDDKRVADFTRFHAHFGDVGDAFAHVGAPGRVNLIGEHTDYHEGFVLPAAIELSVRAVGRARSDRTVRLYSETFGEEHVFSLAEQQSDHSGWARRAEGIIRTVLAPATIERDVLGMDAWMVADLPVGGGLSSSAASMAALGELAAHLNGIELDRLEFARTLQTAEHRFAGVKCGIMDQLAVLLGRRDHALLLDCRSLAAEHIPLPTQWALVVMDTGVRHDLASSEYNRRPQECAAVLDVLKRRRPEIRSLRDVAIDEVSMVEGDVDPVGYRRIMHVLSENQRVLDTIDAFRAADGERVACLFQASHVSLRDDYEVSCYELDEMVRAAKDAPGQVASRMTGGGFGGCTVNLVERERTKEFAEHVAETFIERTGRRAEAIITAASDGLTTTT